MKLQNYNICYYFDSGEVSVKKDGFYDVNRDFIESVAELKPIESYRSVKNTKKNFLGREVTYHEEVFDKTYKLYEYTMSSGKEFLFDVSFDIETKSFKTEEVWLINSVLNYTGGKFKLLPQLLPLFPSKINTFVDGFTGGANVVANVESYCNVQKKVAIDIQKPLIQLFQEMQSENNFQEDIEKIINAFNLNKENEQGYLKVRELYNGLEDCAYKSQLLFVLICHSFNNQIRFNKKGGFNLPFGKQRSSYNKAIQKRLNLFSEKIKDVEFIHGTYEEYELKQGDYLYCDPPYLVTTATYNTGWGIEEEFKLLASLDSLDEQGINFGLSNVFESKGKENTILKEWAKTYNVHYLNKSYANCSYHGKNKDKPTVEVFITNYKTNN